MRNGAIFQGGTRVHSLDTDNQGVTIQSNSGTYRARMVVIATGAATGLLNRLGLLTKQPQSIVAARAYFEDIVHLQECLEFCFSGVTLPGYGWIFPTSKTTANVGTGYVVRPDRRNQPLSPRSAFTTFLHDPYVHQVLSGANQVTEVKTYPIRTDFARTSTFGRRVLLVGEAAGLVNPLTGDGIDYALESGKLPHNIS